MKTDVDKAYVSIAVIIRSKVGIQVTEALLPFSSSTKTLTHPHITHARTVYSQIPLPVAVVHDRASFCSIRSTLTAVISRCSIISHISLYYLKPSMYTLIYFCSNIFELNNKTLLQWSSNDRPRSSCPLLQATGNTSGLLQVDGSLAPLFLMLFHFVELYTMVMH